MLTLVGAPEAVYLPTGEQEHKGVYTLNAALT
jgi:hypothetical protein